MTIADVRRPFPRGQIRRVGWRRRLLEDLGKKGLAVGQWRRPRRQRGPEKLFGGRVEEDRFSTGLDKFEYESAPD